MSDKLAAFRAFDFDSHAGWQSYRLNLEVPPGKEALLAKFKAKWYKANVDPDFDVSLVTAAGAAAPPKEEPAPPPPPPTSSSARGEERPAGSSSTQQPASSAAGGSSSWWRKLVPTSVDARQLGLFMVHVVVVLTGVVSLSPLNRLMAWKAFFVCLRAAMVAQAGKVMMAHGAPRFRPFPAALQAWVQPVAASTDFFYLMSAMLMLQNPGMWLGVVPLAILSLYHASAFYNTNFGTHPLWQQYGLRLHRWLAANKDAALRVCAVADIAMGFQAILSIPRMGLMRAAVPAYVFWNQLRLRFWTPESRSYHVWAWSQLGARVQPLLTAVPALQCYIGLAQRWFEQPMQGRQ